MSPAAKPGAPNAARGLVIVVVAALVGLFLLYRGGSSSLLASGASKTTNHTSTTVAGVPTIPKPTASTAPPATNAPASVKVAIYNGTGGQDPSAAGNNKAKLGPAGYTQVSIDDTTVTPKSVVYFTSGAGGDAAAIASKLGLTDAKVEPTTSAASLPPSSQGASVVVIIGQDAASSSSTSPGK